MEAKAPLVSFLIKISTFILRVSPSSQTGQFISGKRKKMQIWMNTWKILKSTWFIPNFSLGLCWEVKLKSKSELSDLITVNYAESKQALGFYIFFLISPPLQSTNVMDKGQTHYSWLSICLVQMQALKWEASFHGQHPGPCAPVTNVCKTHTGVKSKS